MVEPSRYRVSDEGAGVSGGILKNKLGTKNKNRLDDAETLLLADAYAHFFELLKKEMIRFDLSLLFSIHHYFLNPLYDWAGQVRMVDISKGGMLFAPIKYIDEALREFKKSLKKNLPKRSDTKDNFSRKIAIIHNEFNAIHPFREGNGRAIRLFLDLLVSSLGYDPIDWGKTSKAGYTKACVDGMRGKNEIMAKVIKKGLKKRK